MTLVVSEVSEYGIVMLGDSAISEQAFSDLPPYSPLTQPIVKSVNVAKVFYLSRVNIAVSMWGYACMMNDGRRVPAHPLVRSFLEEISRDGIDLETLGSDLAKFSTERLEPLLAEYGGWSGLRCGFHVGGYIDSSPALYHVHCQLDGIEDEAHEPRLYKDFPDDRGLEVTRQMAFGGDLGICSPYLDIGDTTSAGSWGGGYPTGTSCGSPLPYPFPPGTPADIAIRSLRENGFFHLRNGAIDDFIDSFDNLYGRTRDDVVHKGTQCLARDLDERYRFYQGLVEEVCDMYSGMRFGQPYLVGRPIFGCWFNDRGDNRQFFDGAIDTSEDGCLAAAIRF